MLKNLLKQYSHINWVLADQAMVSGVNFLTGLLLARFLGLHEFGSYTLIWMAVLFVNSFQMAMISAPMMSIGPKQPLDESDLYYRAVLSQQALFSLISFLLLFCAIKLASVLKPEWPVEGLALPVALSGTFFQYQDFLRRYFFCRQLAASAFWNDVISYLGQIVLLVGLFFSIGLNIAGVLWVIASTSFVAIMFGLAKIDFQLVSKQEFKKISRRHWMFSKWSTLSALLQWGSGNLVFIITGSVLGAASVGVLKAAQNIMAVSHILFQGMENFVPAQASRKITTLGIVALQKYINKVVLAGGLVTISFATVIFIFSNEVLDLVYGDVYSRYGYVLQWFAVIYVFMFLCFPYRAALRAIENTKAIFQSQVAASLFVIMFCYALVQSFELTGALVSLLTVYLIVIIYLLVSFSGSVNLLKIQRHV